MCIKHLYVSSFIITEEREHKEILDSVLSSMCSSQAALGIE